MNKAVLDRMAEKFPNLPGTGTFCTKEATIDMPDVDMKNRTVSGLVSVAVPDMDNEVVLPGGLDFSYFPTKVKSVYYSHNYDAMPVGVCRNMALRDEGRSLWALTYVQPSAFGDDLLTAMKAGAVNGFSIGMKVQEMGPPTAQEIADYGACENVVRKAMIFEYSITPMPACPDALMDLASKGMIHRSSAEKFGLVAPPRTRCVVIVEGASYVR